MVPAVPVVGYESVKGPLVGSAELGMAEAVDELVPLTVSGTSTVVLGWCPVRVQSSPQRLSAGRQKFVRH